MPLVTYKEAERKEHYKTSGTDWVKTCTEHEFQIDQMYRKLTWICNEAGMPEEWSELRNRMTEWYEKVFLTGLSRYIDELISSERASHRPIRAVKQQTGFFRNFIRPILDKSPERIFVIISDALRYEAGIELAEKLRSRLNADISTSPMQAAIPTYTQLGMACLLPGTVTRIDDQGTVYVDGIPARGGWPTGRKSCRKLFRMPKHSVWTNFCNLARKD